MYNEIISNRCMKIDNSNEDIALYGSNSRG